MYLTTSRFPTVSQQVTRPRKVNGSEPPRSLKGKVCDYISGTTSRARPGSQRAEWIGCSSIPNHEIRENEMWFSVFPSFWAVVRPSPRSTNPSPFPSSAAKRLPEAANRSTALQMLILLRPNSSRTVFSGLDPSLSLRAGPKRTAAAPRRLNSCHSRLQRF
jgi:hypothetical protein